MFEATEIPPTENGWRNYPIVIRQSRYGGVYESGKWFALANCDAIPADDLMDYLEGDDCDAFYFFDNPANIIGIGNTPNDAHLDLIHKINNTSAVETQPPLDPSVQE